MKRLSPASQDWDERHFNFLFTLIIVGSALLFVVLNSQYSTGVYNDDAVYVIAARQLADPSAIRSLIVKPDYPLPGLPLLLAPLIKVTGDDWIALEWLSVLVSMALVFLVERWVRPWLTAGETLAVTALFALNPLVIKFAGILMPAPYYAIVVILSFVLLRQLLEKPSRKKSLALGFLVGWGGVLRPEGFLLLTSIAPALAITNNGRHLLRWVLIPVAGWALFVWYWFHSRPYERTEYGGDLTALASYWSHHFLSGLFFAGEFCRLFLIKALTGISLPKDLSWFFFVVMLLCVGLVTAGFRNVWKQSPSHRTDLVAIALFFLLYCAVHFFWHIASTRYAIPLLPILLLFGIRGFNAWLSPLPRPGWSGLASTPGHG